MNAIAHHLTALYILIAIVLVPLLIAGLWRFIAKRQQRRAQEAMLRGNRLHRNWLESSKQIGEQPREN